MTKGGCAQESTRSNGLMFLDSFQVGEFQRTHDQVQTLFTKAIHPFTKGQSPVHVTGALWSSMGLVKAGRQTDTSLCTALCLFDRQHLAQRLMR